LEKTVREQPQTLEDKLQVLDKEELIHLIAHILTPDFGDITETIENNIAHQKALTQYSGSWWGCDQCNTLRVKLLNF